MSAMDLRSGVFVKIQALADDQFLALYNCDRGKAKCEDCIVMASGKSSLCGLLLNSHTSEILGREMLRRQINKLTE